MFLKLSNAIAISIVNLNQINIKELIRDIEEKEAMRLLKQIIKNNKMILKLQKINIGVISSKGKKEKKEVGKRVEEERIEKKKKKSRQ